jgi:hypothetical protein
VTEKTLSTRFEIPRVLITVTLIFQLSILFVFYTVTKMRENTQNIVRKEGPYEKTEKIGFYPPS